MSLCAKRKRRRRGEAKNSITFKFIISPRESLFADTLVPGESTFEKIVSFSTTEAESCLGHIEMCSDLTARIFFLEANELDFQFVPHTPKQTYSVTVSTCLASFISWLFTETSHPKTPNSVTVSASLHRPRLGYSVTETSKSRQAIALYIIAVPSSS